MYNLKKYFHLLQQCCYKCRNAILVFLSFLLPTRLENIYGQLSKAKMFIIAWNCLHLCLFPFVPSVMSCPHHPHMPKR